MRVLGVSVTWSSNSEFDVSNRLLDPENLVSDKYI